MPPRSLASAYNGENAVGPVEAAVINAWTIELGTNATIQRMLEEAAETGSASLDLRGLFFYAAAQGAATKRALVILAQAIDGIDQPRT